MTPFFAHVIGTEAKQHKVITGLGREFKQRGMKSGCLVQTNHHVGSRELACLNPTRGTWFEDEVEWYFDTYPRLESLNCRLEEPPTTLAAVHQRLRGRPVTFENTMQQMIFQPASGYSNALVRE
jgi:hypothetical protein